MLSAASWGVLVAEGRPLRWSQLSALRAHPQPAKRNSRAGQNPKSLFLEQFWHFQSRKRRKHRAKLQGSAGVNKSSNNKMFEMFDKELFLAPRLAVPLIFLPL